MRARAPHCKRPATLIEAVRRAPKAANFSIRSLNACSAPRPRASPGACSERSVPAGQELRWILRHAVDQHFEVKMRARRAPRSADFADQLAAADEVAGLHEHLRVVGIPRDEAVAMFVGPRVLSGLRS